MEILIYILSGGDSLEVPPVNLRLVVKLKGVNTSPRLAAWRIHFLLKSSSIKCACRRIDLKVPMGISLLPVGIITVSVDLPVLRYLMWLPFCEI